MIGDDVDPALKEVARRTGAAAVVPVAARLRDPDASVPGLRVRARFGAIVTGRARVRALGAIRRHPAVASLKAARPCGAGDAISAAGDVPAAAIPVGVPAVGVPGGVTGRGVVVAAIDFGFDVGHAGLRDRRGRTRFRWLWDQRGAGRVLGHRAIDAALAAPDPYAALGYDPADADDGSGAHGTHVLSIAARIAPGAELIGVHLRGTDTRPDDTLGDSVRLLEALRFVADRAAGDPLVVNVSLGVHGGPHDGTTLVEQAIDWLVSSRPGVSVVMSAGNYFDAGVHAAGTVAAGAHRDLCWDAPPAASYGPAGSAAVGAPAELEVWYRRADELAVELIDPAGRTVACAPLGTSRVATDAAGRTVATLHHRRADPNNGDHHVDLFLWPAAPAGRWTTRLHAVAVPAGGGFHAWLERGDAGAQPRFAPGHARPTATTNAICNGRLAITVGAYDDRDPACALVPFTSSGPTRDRRRKPELTAPGAAIWAARSSRPGARDATAQSCKSGTSMAAPYVAGVVALMFEAAAPARLEAATTRAILFRTARRGPPATAADELRYGRGRIDPAAAVAMTLGQKARP
jgi:subtilisin family serine protease